MFVVKEVNLGHLYHATDRVTYEHYPENLRLNQDEMLYAEKVISVGSNKKLVKIELMKKRDGKTVSMQTLHNVQTKMRTNKVGGAGSELEKLHNILIAIPGAKVRFITNEKDEILGKCVDWT